ncbi:MAG TPA: CRISPR-associated endonuclease Cas1, partial [Candidatus Hydrogenedentes bacterium]|nr:CRISPR-associated endonuclease Cas1 [Candidatus Hydrogenedentota bacterium]
VNWTGRNYKVDNWNDADPVNRALSVANACLYGLCHAAILAGGFSPALGFIHQGNMLSFVYDIADLYKTEYSIPIAFQLGAQNPSELERVVRMTCRQWFYQTRLLSRVIPDIRAALGMTRKGDPAADIADAPLALWDPDEGECPAAQNYDPELMEQQNPPNTGQSEDPTSPEETTP